MFTFFAPLHRGLKPEVQSIEVWTSLAIPSFRVVGLPGPEIIESCERVRAAIETSGMEFPRRRVLVNLSPAGVKKQGTGTDLAIALAVMATSFEKERKSTLETRCFIASGELALNGSVRSAGRVLRACRAALEHGISELILARADEPQASRALQLLGMPNLKIHLIEHLSEAPLLFDSSSNTPGSPLQQHPLETEQAPSIDLLPLEPDLERTLAVAASGAHHLLLIGPKGTGKTAALKWLQALRSTISTQELLDRLSLEELSEPHTPLIIRQAPIRVVSPQIRPEALIGGVSRGELRPGELSQA
ncbi:MAG: hypothetical protein RJB38_134, partial [Pseudomonadota bacterium]